MMQKRCSQAFFARLGLRLGSEQKRHALAGGSWPGRLLIALLAATLPCGGMAQRLFIGSDETIPPEVERMYQRGLGYLVRTQGPEGFWTDPQGRQPAVVALAVLSMLAHGDDPNTGPYSQAIKRGLNFILDQQNDLSGYIGTTMYNHGFATLALAEAYGHVEDKRLGIALQKAVDLILKSQASNPFGAWRYSPQSRDADTTVSGAQMVALFAARNAGIEVPDAAIKKGLEFYRQCQSADGGFGYTGPGASNLPRTAIGCLVLILAKQRNTPAFQAAVRFLKSAQFTESHYFYYYLYYVSQVYFHLSPQDWDRFNRMNIKQLQTTQRDDGGWDGAQGPTFSTACALLSLALNYRYLPIYER